MPFKDFYAQLKERRVIRAAIIYIALLWAMLQVADLLADAQLISAAAVRWTIIVGVLGLPLTLFGSWFIESPWRGRRWTAIAGDLLIISAIGVAALLFAWQQWFQSVTRSTIAIVRIEATDTRADTQDLAGHIAGRFRTALASRPEIQVIELASSQNAALTDLPVSEKALWLGADYLVGGTASQNDSTIRLSLQVFAADGSLLWGGRFEDRVIDQVQLQNRVLADLWPFLPLVESSLSRAQEVLASCEYPASADAILAVVAAPARMVDGLALDDLIASTTDNGLLHLARARQLFAEIGDAPPPRRPVMQQLAMQHLAFADDQCPGFPPIELLRIENTLVLAESGDTAEKYASRHPNSAAVYLGMARQYRKNGDTATALGLMQLAFDLAPASGDVLCEYRALIQDDENKDQDDILKELSHNFVRFALDSCKI